MDVPNYVIKAFEEVRESGKTNMFDSNAVLYYMHEFNHYEAVTWLAEIVDDKVVCNKKKYSAVLQTYSDIFKVASQLS